MKTHTRKKLDQSIRKAAAQTGLINNAQGQWVNRSSLPDTSMKRDFSPQGGK